MPIPSASGADSISVPIGRWAVASSPTRLRTLLGSCVGVVLYDRVEKIGAVAHLVLPDSRGAVDHPGKYADTAIPAMVADLERLSKSKLGLRGRLIAKLAGGASLFSHVSGPNIGQLNRDAAERILGELGIRITARDLGGGAGRHLSLDTATGIVTIRVPGGEETEL